MRKKTEVGEKSSASVFALYAAVIRQMSRFLVKSQPGILSAFKLSKGREGNLDAI